MSRFAQAQRDYLLGERRLGRIATVGRDGTPHVVPIGHWSYNEELDTIDVTGRDAERTKWFRDVIRSGRAAIVVDDVDSGPRAVEVRGRAEAITRPQALIRIHPDHVASWGLD